VKQQVISFDELLSSILQAGLAQVQVAENEDMRRISAWVAILAVPTVIAGIYGMNFDYMPELRIKYAYFVLTGIISLVSEMREGTVEVGTVGCEGMTGIPLVLSADTMPSRAFVQVPGEALRMTAEDLLRGMEEVPVFRRLVYRHVLALFDQTAQHAACNRLHALEERCARWLLMTHDRVEGDVLLLKQQFLAEMLGVHRPAVTLAAGALQKAGIIRYSRGKVTVLDRAALEAASCECYSIVTRRMEELLAMQI